MLSSSLKKTDSPAGAILTYLVGRAGYFMQNYKKNVILESITEWRSVPSSEIGKDDGSLYNVNQ